MIEVIHSLKKFQEKTCVALGYFDGIHMGHKCIIKTMVDIAKKKGLTPVVFTFSENPREVLTGRQMKKIIGMDDKKLILSSLGVEKVYMINFSSIMKLSADEFINQILINTLNAADVFCGFNYHFGAGKFGDCNYLKQRLNLAGVNVYISEAVNYKGEIVSSTGIKKLISEGNIEKANFMLTRNFSFKGRVIEGKKLGRRLGFPTINQEFPETLVLPKFGVYKTVVKVKGATFASITNIGVNPTISISENPIVETFILNYDGGSLYGEIVEVKFLKFLRAEKKFNSLVELKDDINSLLCKI